MTSVLPAGVPKARHHDGRSGADSRLRGSRSDHPSLLLFVADVEIAAAEQLAEDLAEHNVTALLCSDGAEALLVAGAEQPDAVLAAAALPTVAGAALTRALSARTTIPVLPSRSACTGGSSAYRCGSCACSSS